MKKIGILFGKERSFPPAFIAKVNEIAPKGIVAEAVSIDKVVQGDASEYAVIIDRISQDVPFYRAFLKNAASCGTAVINNPFWWSADEKFFNNALALKVGVPVPKTVLLPSNEWPDDTNSDSFSNLAYPLDWQGIFDYVGFPAYMKPFDGGGWRDVYKVTDKEDLFKKHAQTGRLVMLLQEEIKFTEYFRCYCLGGKYVHIMPYAPNNPHHLRYVVDQDQPTDPKLLKTIEEYVLKLNHALGYDFNTVEFAIRDGVPYAIDFCNPAPDAGLESVGQENFDWIVEHAAKYAIERAEAHVDGEDNLTWGTFVKNGVANSNVPTIATEAIAPVKKATPKKAPVAKKAPAKKATTTKTTTAKKTTAAKSTTAKKAAPKKATAKKTTTRKKAVLA